MFLCYIIIGVFLTCRIFTVENSVCDLRTVGVLIKDGKMLVQQDRDGSEYALLGGHVKIGETLEDGLKREFKEEIELVQCIQGGKND